MLRTCAGEQRLRRFKVDALAQVTVFCEVL
jgi:hypothetical protein